MADEKRRRPTAESPVRLAIRGVRSSILPFAVVSFVTLGAWRFTISQAGWEVDRQGNSPPDIAFTWVLLVFFVAGLVSGVVGRDRAGWIGAAGGLVSGSAAAAVLWSEPKLVLPALTILELAPLTLGYAIGRLLTDPRRRTQLIFACALGLWLPFTALAILGVLAALSSPGLGEHDWTTVLVAALVVVLIPLGARLIRSGATQRLGRLALVVLGWGVAAWALLDGGYGRPLWKAEVSPPLIAVMLAGVVLGLLLGLTAMVYRVEPIASSGERL